MKFSEVLSLLEEGKVIRRSGWGASFVVFKQVPAHIGAAIIPNMQSLPSSAKEVILQTTGHIDYTSQCLIFNTVSGRADSWTPSSSDMFADDWHEIDVE